MTRHRSGEYLQYLNHTSTPAPLPRRGAIHRTRIAGDVDLRLNVENIASQYPRNHPSLGGLKVFNQKYLYNG